MTKSTQPFQSHERPPAEERSEMLRRVSVINAATDGEHQAELAIYPDLFQQAITEQSAAVLPQSGVNAVEAAPAGGVAIDLAARREQQAVSAEVQHLANLRRQINDLAA